MFAPSWAARNAIADAGLAPEDIELVMVCTATPDQAFPPTAVQVIENLTAADQAGRSIRRNEVFAAGRTAYPV